MFVELVLLLVVLVVWTIYKDAKPRNMPPGPAEVPFYGNLVLCQVKDLIRLREKYGKIYTTRYGNIRNVTVCDYEVAKTALASPDFSGRPYYVKVLFNTKLDEPGGVFFSNGNQWTHDRRFLLRNLRNLGMGKTYLGDAINFEAQELVDNLKALNGKPSYFPKCLRTASLNVVWQLVAGKRYDLQSTELDEVFEILEGLRNKSQKVFYEYLFPGLCYMPTFVSELIWDTADSMSDYREKLAEMPMKNIDEHEAVLDDHDPVDLIDEYLMAMRRDPSSDFLRKSALTQIVIDVFAAGSDTGSNMIRFVVNFMVRFPETKRRCQEEIDRVVPMGTLVSVLHRQDLPYVDAYVQELMRHSSNAFMSVQRMAVRDTTIEGYFIPKGTLLNPDSYFIHRDPKFYTDPEDFNPERFLDKDGKCQHNLNNFIAFGTGRRKCSGENLARMELFLFASALLQNFDIELPPGKQLDQTIADNVVYRVRAPVDQQFIYKPRF